MKISLQEAFQALGVNQSTLYRWLEKADITPEPDSVDTRKKLLTLEQLRDLAEVHGKQLPRVYRQSAYEMHSKSETPIVTDNVTRLRTEIDELKERLARLEKVVEGLQSEKQEQPAIVKTAPSPLEKQELPGDLVTLASFADMHGIPDRTATRHGEKIGARKGTDNKWYLDSRGRAAFYRQFKNHERFKSCDHCPHGPD